LRYAMKVWKRKTHDMLVRNRDVIEKNMMPAQVAEAQKLAREWKPNKGSNKESKTSGHDFNSSPPSVKPATRSIF